MRLLLTRPEESSAAFGRALEVRGHNVMQAPLLRIELLPVRCDFSSVQALIVTSGHALRALAESPALAAPRSLALLAVGPATAARARDLGFSDVYEGPGSAAELVPFIRETLKPEAGPLLYLSGDAVAFDMEPALRGEGFNFLRAIVYRAVAAAALPADAVTALASRTLDAVLLMSPRSSRTYVELIRHHGLVSFVPALPHLCLSARVADPLADLGIAARDVAVQPNSAAMIALVDQVAAGRAGAHAPAEPNAQRVFRR